MTPLPVNWMLVIAEAPKYAPPNPLPPAYSDFVRNIEKNVPPPEGTQRIHDNIWLLPITGASQWLGSLALWTAQYGVSLRVSYLEKEPHWTVYKPGFAP
jgi:hypothetical protein